MRASTYSDIDQSLKSNLLYDIDSIKQSLINILTTRKGTRLFNSEFGTDLGKYLFELMDDITEFALMSEIITAVNRWEPRVSIDPNSLIVKYKSDHHAWHVKIIFVVKSFPTQRHELSWTAKK